MPANVTPQQRQTMAERAYEEIRIRIIDNRLVPGTPVDEEQLMADLSVGRTPLREAVKRLESERLLVIYSHRGTFVPEVTIRDLREISDARRVLEGYAARRAAEAASDTDLQRLAASQRELQALRDTEPTNLIDIDSRMHESIYRAMGNRYVESTLRQFFSLSQRMWNYVLPRLAPMKSHVDEHLDLLQVVMEGNADEAEELAAAHVTHFEEIVVAAL